MSKFFLSDIVEHKKELLVERSELFSSFKKHIRPREYSIKFKEVISRPGGVNIIAEIKKASPSKGVIAQDFDPLAIAQVYQQCKVSAISVLTEEKYFLGNPLFIKEITEQIDIPVLAKDFIIDPVQIHEACLNGASAVLLIVAILEDDQLQGLMAVAKEVGLDCLVEIHDAHELERACQAGAEIIGINNRDLTTFQVNMDTCLQLIPKVPKGKVIVAESGFVKYRDICEVGKLGAHAVLIGETLMCADDPAEKVKEVMGK